MVVLNTVETSNDGLLPIKAIPLTPESFKEFGAIISADHQVNDAPQSVANQGTALKLHKVAPVTNNYADAPSGTPATANWNIFRCSAPLHLIEKNKENDGYLYTAKVLERHPYTTQTFTPMGKDKDQIGYLVICAPNDPQTDRPDYKKAKGFICKGNQSVTYGVSTWHAPMIALGEGYIDFAVLVHENGVPEEDCEEIVYDPGFFISFEQ
ncbi:hypothetical protein B5S28_g4510 [[Candida] boidinii]|uniref:Unnamed protein product n=1 Tax=Candida boidinii TaxID=5477 RepID=A0ACB5TKZ3_CANBO|nr:hypothetical protein B5S28_g4510 [[Candida] boidinii]OWB59873.1 hypothetical protein B5S29_g738 [[Candida] boidinii]OWB70951.1 hypothetical protein B5S31_g632 [[Candida] boidinii]OWB80503.1 hypothetical protein B5S32_g4786 [[Candida] boidinii]GME68755.1 unnamed protein product [[Candida] boidinii]